MNASAINISDKYLIFAIKIILEMEKKSKIKILGKYKSHFDYVFVGGDNMSIIELKSIVARISSTTRKFIFVSKKYSYYLIDVFCDNKTTIIFKEDSIDRIKDKIKGVNHEILKKKLSSSEQRVIDLLSNSVGTYELSKRLKISTKTISLHKRNAMKKMFVNSNVELYTLLSLNKNEDKRERLI